MKAAIVVCTAFTVFACGSCRSYSKQVGAKVDAINALRAEAVELAGLSQQAKEAAPSMFSYFIAGFADGVSIGSTGMPTGALFQRIAQGIDADSRLKRIGNQLKTLQAREEMLMHEALALDGERRFWWWLGVLAIGATSGMVWWNYNGLPIHESGSRHW